MCVSAFFFFFASNGNKKLKCVKVSHWFSHFEMNPLSLDCNLIQQIQHLGFLNGDIAKIFSFLWYMQPLNETRW